MKLAIIEDRMRRLKDFQGFEIEKNGNAFIITGTPFSKLLVEFETGNPISLNDFDVIAAHRSALSSIVREVLKAYCRAKKKPLIFFSGGITSSIYKDSEFPFLFLNSKNFYSINLKYFLEHLEVDSAPNLLILQFGLRWKLSLLLGLRDRIAVAQSKQNMMDAGYDIQINERIRRLQDLRISELIKKDLVNDSTKEILSGSSIATLTSKNLSDIRAITEHLINSML